MRNCKTKEGEKKLCHFPQFIRQAAIVATGRIG